MEPEENRFAYKSIEKINRYTTGKVPDLIMNIYGSNPFMYRLLNIIIFFIYFNKI